MAIRLVDRVTLGGSIVLCFCVSQVLLFIRPHTSPHVPHPVFSHTSCCAVMGDSSCCPSRHSFWDSACWASRRLLFKKRMFRETDETITEPQFVNLSYVQAQHDYLQVCILCCTRCARCACIACHARLTHCLHWAGGGARNSRGSALLPANCPTCSGSMTSASMCECAA
jgi:hypothetical protein